MNQEHPLVYFARHGQTTFNKADAFRGNINAPLDAQGWRDANKLKKYFDGVEFSHIFTSDKIRAEQTAGKIAEGHNQTPVENEGLRSWDVGYLSGKPKDEENLEAIEYYVNNPDLPIPDGESLNEFKARVQPLIKNAIELALACGNPVLVIAHSSVIHEVGAMIGGHHEYALVEPGGVTVIFIQDGKFDAEPIFKPKDAVGQQRGETIT